MRFMVFLGWLAIIVVIACAVYAVFPGFGIGVYAIGMYALGLAEGWRSALKETSR